MGHSNLSFTREMMIPISILLDRLQSIIGGVKFLDFNEAATDSIIFGDGSAIHMKFGNGMFMNGSTRQLGIGTNFTTPTARLQINANAAESPLLIKQGTNNMLDMKSDGNIYLGHIGLNGDPIFQSWLPTVINPLGSGRVALTVDGTDITGVPTLIEGGELQVGGVQQVMLMDGDDIQAWDNVNDQVHTIGINRIGGYVTLGNDNYGRVGINTINDPASDLHVFQTDPSSSSSAGIRLESPNIGDYWRLAMNNADDLELYFNGTLKTTCNHTNGAWSGGSDRSLKKIFRRRIQSSIKS